MDYKFGNKYNIDDAEMLKNYTFFPLKNITFIRSYHSNGKVSLVFQYDLKEEDYLNWKFCWAYVAQSTVLRDIRDYNESDDTHKKETYLVETHIYENIIKQITPVEYVGCDYVGQQHDDNLSEKLSELEKRIEALEKQLKIV